jgi:hypothetical protein
MTVLFTSETYIRENSVFNLNVDTKDIYQSAYVAQDMYIEPILGTNLYEALQLSYSAQTLTPDEEILMSFIKPVVAWRATQLTLPFITFNVKNKGPQLQNSDYSNGIGTAELFYIKKEVENRAEWYAQRLLNYLCQNGNLFPLYVSPGTSNTYPDKKISAYDSGFSTYPTNNCLNNNLLNRWFFN